jgi:serine/threonine protein kinase
MSDIKVGLPRIPELWRTEENGRKGREGMDSMEGTFFSHSEIRSLAHENILTFYGAVLGPQKYMFGTFSTIQHFRPKPRKFLMHTKKEPNLPTRTRKKKKYYELIFFLVTELAPNGSLACLMASDNIISFPRSLEWMKQIASGMNHMHSIVPPLLHLDLKPENRT